MFPRRATAASLGSILLLWLLVLALWAAPASAKQGADVVRVSADPYSDPDFQHATEVEPDSFATDSTVVGVFMVGKKAIPAGASNIGFATSARGGKAFTDGFLPITKLAGGPFDETADPSVAYDAAHRVWLISSLAHLAAFPVGGAVLVSRSSDGVHWGQPSTVAPLVAGERIDKPWIACDNSRHSPFFGRCYTGFDDILAGLRLEMSTSTDGGRSWGPAVETEGGGSGQGVQPVIQRDGTVVVPFLGPGPPVTTNSFIGAFRSTDGGETWSTPLTLTQTDYRPPPGMRAPPFPSAEADRAGHVYVVWHDCRFRAGCSANDLVLSKSADGINWSPPARIPIDSIDSGADHFIPGLAVDPHTSGSPARLALTYYSYRDATCTPNTCELTVGFISSRDGGATWGEPRELTEPMPINWFPDSTYGRMVGDYISTSFMHERAFPFFAVANRPDPDGTFDQAIATVRGGLHVKGSFP
jgi:hypothetical protein